MCGHNLCNLQSALLRCAPRVLFISAGRGRAGQGLLFAGRGEHPCSTPKKKKQELVISTWQRHSHHHIHSPAAAALRPERTSRQSVRHPCTSTSPHSTLSFSLLTVERCTIGEWERTKELASLILNHSHLVGWSIGDWSEQKIREGFSVYRTGWMVTFENLDLNSKLDKLAHLTVILICELGDGNAVYSKSPDSRI